MIINLPFESFPIAPMAVVALGRCNIHCATLMVVRDSPPGRKLTWNQSINSSNIAHSDDSFSSPSVSSYLKSIFTTGTFGHIYQQCYRLKFSWPDLGAFSKLIFVNCPEVTDEG